MRRSWLVVLVLGLMALTPPVSASAPEYHMTDLGIVEPGSGSSAARGINNRGQIVGTVSVLEPQGVHWQGFMWDRGEIEMLGEPPEGGPYSVLPRAINSRGQIVGDFQPIGSLDPTGFTYEDGVWAAIPFPGAATSALGVNDRGQVAGFGYGLDSRGFVWDRGDIAYLDFADRVHPQAINNRGLVVGSFWAGWSSQMRAFIWDRGVVTEIGDARGDQWIALDVNNRGDVVGTYREAGSGSISKAFSWRNGQLMDLPGLGDTGVALGVNNRGQIVGASSGHAVVWDHGSVVDLGSGCTAWDVNEAGQIVGDCQIAGETRAFLWER